MSTLEPGFWIAATLKKDSAPLRVYVGEVQEVDDRGIRITLIDWIIGNASGWDMFIPWTSLEAALVATPDHHPQGFADRAAQWQEAMHDRDEE